jgi:hypothetical protein
MQAKITDSVAQEQQHERDVKTAYDAYVQNMRKDNQENKVFMKETRTHHLGHTLPLSVAGREGGVLHPAPPHSSTSVSSSPSQAFSSTQESSSLPRRLVAPPTPAVYAQPAPASAKRVERSTEGGELGPVRRAEEIRRDRYIYVYICLSYVQYVIAD